MNLFLLLNFIAFLLITGYAVYLFVNLVYSRILFIKLGQSSDLKKDMMRTLNVFWVNVFGQKKLLKDRKSGIMHIVLFYGFLLVQFGAVDLIWKGIKPGSHLPLGWAYPYFLLFQEIVVIAILIAILYAWYRRNVEKLPRLKRGWKANLVIWLITSLMVSTLISEAMEIIWLHSDNIGFHSTQPVVSTLAVLLAGIGSKVGSIVFYLFWWMHLITLLFFLVYIPQGKHAHLIFASYNWLAKDKTRPPGKLSTIDFDKLEEVGAEEFGVGRVENFTNNQLIDLYACVECGRCTSMCPASGTGKTLSPMDLIVKMRDHLTEKGAAITGRTPWLPATVFSESKGNMLAMQARETNSLMAAEEVAAAKDHSSALKTEYDISLIGDVITEEELWACTTCRNCEDQCPVANEHVGHIIDMRRFLIMTEGKVPTDAQRALNNIERQSNPWGINRKDRIKWREGMEDLVPTVKEAEEFDYLFFVGSMGSFDNRSIKLTQSFVRLMNKAGVKFAILGKEEKNSGDTPRRLGNELLFQELAAENISTFQKYGVEKIVTMDPHAYNTFKNEYPEFGLDGVEVYHHTELLVKWLEEGRIKPVNEVKERVTFHDSCYLGRYNEIYDAPRKILSAIPGVSIAEMKRTGSDSMCCGAGGGMMWQEENQGTRINIARTEQALEVNPTVIGSACPYCLTMLSDGTKAKEVEDKVKTLDMVEILEKSLL
ncbi:heterodisulfide reductase-related iron-sulfur binding cluster [Peribacillus frigoritolerans]|uniref:(Fe-S)-binding protein n=1 Tax=Peribacillus frigoritolerans TaxID=450367 RepID=UPI0021CFE369|nr:(Fe-S)-binding protein [Peribacillus frigoritolerans]MCU6599000.1 heterodisulfide reductase-related iron-sulfur binding cluster [Peribacillus frigoritolerans]